MHHTQDRWFPPRTCTLGLGAWLAATCAAPAAPKRATPPAWADQAIWYEIDFPAFSGNTAEVTDFERLARLLPHVRALGANTVYLNNLFMPAGAHRIDHRHIGPPPSPLTDAQATWTPTSVDRAFQSFCQAAHQRGIRVLATVALHDALPVPAPAAPFDFFKRVGRHWLDPDNDRRTLDGLDGYVVVKPLRLPPDFWPEWCKAMREKRPDVLLVADPADRPGLWQKGDTFDCAWNRQTGGLLQDLPRSDKRAAIHQFMQRLAAMPQGATHCPVPISSSKRRILAALTPPRPAGEDVSAKWLAEARARWRLAAILQYTLPGAPVIYWGDELGFDDQGRVTDRLTFADSAVRPEGWDGDEDHFGPLLNWLAYRRAHHPALRSGDFANVPVEADGVVAFARQVPTERVTVVLNFSHRPRPVELTVGGAALRIGVLTPQLVTVQGPRGPVPPVGAKTAGVRALRAKGYRKFTDQRGRISVKVPARGVVFIMAGKEAGR